MSRRLPIIGLIVAALLAARAQAKPPDLPLPQNDVLAPPAAAGPATLYEFPAAAPAEAPLFFRVRPSVRRTLASCLLFGANPLLALAPTEEYVDFDEDDVPQGSIPASFVINAATEDAPPAATTPQPIRPTPTATASEDAMPSACPWMRQQQCGAGHSVVVSADIDLSHDVLRNLEMLREAQNLLQNARELGGAGNVCEAMQCLQLAHDLCPGSWLDHRIDEAAAEVFASAYGNRRMRVTYAVADLLDGGRSHPILPAAGGAPAPEERLIKLITTTVEPREWSVNGGPGTIDYHPLTHALIINQTPDIQEQVVDLLESMRRRQLDGEAEEHRDDAPLRQELPPVDAQVPAILDHLYPEISRPVPPEDGEQQEPPVPQPGAAKPLPKQGDHEEVGCGKDGGAPISCLEVLKEFAAVEPPGHGELWFGFDGSVRMFTQLRQGGAVWHVLYNNGGLSVWASPDGGAPTANPPDDDSGD